MGDKKKRKEKEKEKKKDKKKDRDEKKRKKDKYNSSSSESDDSDSDSDSSKSVSRSKKKDKQKKINKKEKKSKKESPKKEVASSNLPYNFDNVTSAPPLPSAMPGIKLPVIPPPASAPAPATVPKPKSKEPNIFKLLPKLNYGPVLFAKTIYSGEYLSESSLDKLLVEMTRNIEQTTKEEQHKKGLANILKCIGDLDKVFAEERQEKIRNAAIKEEELLPKQTNNRYELLEKVYHEQILKITSQVDSV